MLAKVILTAHLFVAISWMAAMFYLPRLFVYHAEAIHHKKPKAVAENLAVMEKNLQRFIMNPSMIATFGLGVWLTFIQFGHPPNWLVAKFVLLLLLGGFHGMCAKHRKLLLSGKAIPSGRFYRYFNEIPTLLLLGILVLAIFKPFS